MGGPLSCHCGFIPTSLARCLTYIDLSKVRAGIVKDPAAWPESGYAEIINGRQRYQLVDHRTLAALLDLSTLEDLCLARQNWIKASSEQKLLTRDNCWSEELAVGSAELLRR